MSTALRVNFPEVINETIDGEAVMINLRTGTYYSLAGSGVDVWSALENVATLEEVVEHLVHRYEAPRHVIHDDVTGLVEQLRSEELIVPAEGPPSDRPALVALPDANAPRVGYKPPALEKYTDMQDLILLDPVHEIDHDTWQQPAANQGPA